MLYFLLLSGAFFLAPIIYTFLRLAEKIGPKEENNAAILGIVLWIIGLITGSMFGATAHDIWLSLPK